jgi:hypothetical protein
MLDSFLQLKDVKKWKPCGWVPGVRGVIGELTLESSSSSSSSFSKLTSFGFLLTKDEYILKREKEKEKEERVII